jgi:hypothetical protein
VAIADHNIKVAMKSFATDLKDIGYGRSRNCQLSTNFVGGTPGWSYVLTYVTVRGLLTTAPGTSVQLKTTAFWSADANQSVSSPLLFDSGEH